MNQTIARHADAGHAAMGPRGGFTLIELLVVIGIIAILITIVTTVGTSVLSGGRDRQTADAIRAVDMAVEAYFETAGTAPPAMVVAWSPGGPQPDDPGFTYESFAAYPLIDGVDMTNGSVDRTVVNSIGLFMRALENEGLGDVLSTVSGEMIARWDGDYAVVDPDGTIDDADGGRQPEMRVIIDAWGKPLRFVHPAWDGIVTEENNQGQIRPEGRFGDPVRPITTVAPDPAFDYWLPLARAPEGFDPSDPAQFPIAEVRRDRLTLEDRRDWNGDGAPIGDGDGGYTIGGRPYVYSGGADDDPSTTENNVYTTTPRFAAE